MKTILALLWVFSAVVRPSGHWEAVTPVLISRQPGITVTQTLTPIDHSNRFMVELEVAMEEELLSLQQEAFATETMVLHPSIVRTASPAPLEKREALEYLGRLRFVLCEDVVLAGSLPENCEAIDANALCWDVFAQMRRENSTSVSISFGIEVRAPHTRYGSETGNLIQLQSTLVYAGKLQEDVADRYRLDLAGAKVRFQ